jgi:hypothetical protein
MVVCSRRSTRVRIMSSTWFISRPSRFFAELFEPSGDQVLGGRGRTAEGLGHLLLGHVVAVAQDHGRALPRRESPQGMDQLVGDPDVRHRLDGIRFGREASEMSPLQPQPPQND